MNQQLHTNLLIAARRLIRVAYEPADELLSEDDNWDQVAYAMALLRCQVQALDIEQLNNDLETQQTRAERAEQALERRQADYEQLQSMNIQLREKLRLSQQAAQQAQNDYSARISTVWQCQRCKQHTRPSERDPRLCEWCGSGSGSNGYADERLVAHQGDL